MDEKEKSVKWVASFHARELTHHASIMRALTPTVMD